MTIASFDVVDDPVATGARVIADAANACIGARGRCALAVSRGADLFRALAASGVNWAQVDVFQVDERAAPDGSEDRNETAIRRELASTGARIHPMPVTAPDLDAAAAHYSTALEAVCGSPPVLDVVHLGIGPDGHTASLVPGDPVLDVTDRWVALTGSYEGYRRMTLTYPALDRARSVVMIATGAAKARAVTALRAGDTQIPAGRLHVVPMAVIVDAAAASEG